MKTETAISALKEKQAIISRTDDDHWLYEPIATVLEELEVYKKALELACEEHYWCSSTESLMNEYIDEARNELKKAREQNDN